MKYKELIDAIINEQAHDAKELIETTLSKKIEVQVDEHRTDVTESLFGLKKNSVEVTEENFEELLNGLSEEDTNALAEELAALEAEGLSEEELSEISKERVANYATKALANRSKEYKNNSKAQTDSNKKAASAAQVKRSGPDKDYGETDSSHADRVYNTAKRATAAKKAVVDSDRKIKNRNIGLHRAGERLAKD